MPKTNLRVVVPSPESECVDIHQLVLADCRGKGREHWARVHAAADKRAPLFMLDRIKRTWLSPPKTSRETQP